MCGSPVAEMGCLVGPSVAGASRAVDGTFFSAETLAGPLWGRKRLQEGDLTDKRRQVYGSWAQCRDNWREWRILFFPAASVWGAFSPSQTHQTGLPQPPVTRATLSFILVESEKGPFNKTTGMKRDCVCWSGCLKSPLPTGEVQRAAQPSGDL